jgi:mRNA interferase RelE/StbE
MNVLYAKRFDKDIDGISHNTILLQKLAHKIAEIKTCKSLNDVDNVKKLEGHPSYFRIKIGNYRLGIRISDDSAILLRFLHRKEIYRYFPP